LFVFRDGGNGPDREPDRFVIAKSLELDVPAGSGAWRRIG
jgi:hypothetical protein